jgi:hypothetical protein
MSVGLKYDGVFKALWNVLELAYDENKGPAKHFTTIFIFQAEKYFKINL